MNDYGKLVGDPDGVDMGIDDPFHESTTPIVRAVRDAVQRGGWLDGTPLPPHRLVCYGCGPENPASLGLRAEVNGSTDGAVRARIVFDDRFIGAPGVAHGGAISAAFDDAFGYVLVRALSPAVTRDLKIRYRLPVRLDVEAMIDARLVGREDRELHVEGELTQADRVCARATAVFVEVDREHMASPADRFP